MKLTTEPLAMSAGADTAPSDTGSAPMRSERQRFLIYLMVGSLGFIVDACLVAVQVHLLGIGPYVARGPSFAVAVTVTWMLNRAHTFKGMQRHSVGKSYRRYILAQVIGALANLGVYAAAIANIAICAKYPVAAVAIASGFALLVNYALARLFVFPGTPDPIS
jgi:putative flippase GtrA